MSETIERGLLSLYKELYVDDFDLTQLGDEGFVDAMSISPVAALPALAGTVDLSQRRDRYAANLAYVLSLRCIELHATPIETEAANLGQLILGRFDAAELAAAEELLRDGIKRLFDSPMMKSDVAEKFEEAFGTSLQFTINDDDSITFTGPAAETAAMFSELACMDVDINAELGVVAVGNERYDVMKIQYELCTQVPWDRMKVTVDPRNWHTYNPGFFDKITVLTSPPTTTDWCGVIQEEVGAVLTGSPIVTNLYVTYYEQPGLAVTAYDLAPDALAVTPDDGRVKVDYGIFAITNEGVHRRVRVLKVVHVAGYEWVPKWMWPLLAQQLVMIGWWF